LSLVEVVTKVEVPIPVVNVEAPRGCGIKHEYGEKGRVIGTVPR